MIIRDSSSGNFFKHGSTVESGQLRVGLVRDRVFDEKTKTHLYIVEAYSQGRRIYMRCNQLSRFGDVWNFEEWGIRSLDNNTPIKAEESNMIAKPGEVVVVAALNGIDLDGVIIGCLLHPSRESKIEEKELSYYKSYNGLETTITKDGEYSLIFNGSPTNTPSTFMGLPKIPQPKYNDNVAGSYFKISKEGNIEFSDAHREIKQSLTINKGESFVEIISGDIVLKIDGKNKEILLFTKNLKIEAEDIVNIEAKSISLVAESTMKLSSPKIAIGTSGIELLDQLVQLIDAIGTVVVNSPVGPCQPIKTSPMWVQVEALKIKINSIKGSL